MTEQDLILGDEPSYIDQLSDRQLLEEIHTMLVKLTAPKKERKKAEPEYDEAFEAFWQVYPRKVAKKSAQSAWRHLNQLQRQKALEVIDQFADAWKARNELEFIPHASTWLNQHRFFDEVGQALPTLKVKLPRDLNELVQFAKQRGISTQPGESEYDFRRRVEDKI